MVSSTKESPSKLKMSAIVAVGILSIIILFCFNPEDVDWMPRCLFFSLTGLKCPGCGTLRGLHYMLHLKISDAWEMNPFMVVGLPLTGVLLLVPRWHKNAKIGIFITAATLTWWIVRNI